MNYFLIEKNYQLHLACQNASKHPAITLDTEFVRTNTYYPQLGLIQLYDGEKIVLIDPLYITDWTSFINLLKNQYIIKFLHASNEDLEVFFHYFDCIPTPMLDTQIMAAFSGKPLSWGFASMVLHFNKIKLDKSEARTNWLMRPLTIRQCKYAAADVSYLLPIANQLLLQTINTGNIAAVFNECEMLCQRQLNTLKPEDAWCKITNASDLNPRQLILLQKLAAWRLCVARKSNIALNFVVRSDKIFKLAQLMPERLSDLRDVGLDNNEIYLHGMEIISIIEKVQSQKEIILPQSLKNFLTKHIMYMKAFRAIQKLVSQVSQESGYGKDLLASRRQIHQLLNIYCKFNNSTHTPEIMTGWRSRLLKNGINSILYKIF